GVLSVSTGGRANGGNATGYFIKLYATAGAGFRIGRLDYALLSAASAAGSTGIGRSGSARSRSESLIEERISSHYGDDLRSIKVGWGITCHRVKGDEQ